MRVNWRHIPSAHNSYAVLSAACEESGFSLARVNRPAADVTCYSLNSFSAKKLWHEIATCRLCDRRRGSSCNRLLP